MNGHQKLYYPKKYWNNRLKEHCNLEGVGCLGLGGLFNTYVYKAKVRTLRRIAKRLGISFQRKEILDVGSGIGFWIDYYISNGGKRIFGVDISSEAVQYLRRKYANQNMVKVFEGDFSTLDFGKVFDFVSAFDVSYHVVDDNLWRNFIENLCKHTKNHGFIFISDTFRKDYRDKITHVKFRPLTAYERIFRKNGVKIVDVVPIYSVLGWPFTGRQKIDKLLTIVYVLLTYTCRISKALTIFAYHVDSLLTHFKLFGISTKLLIAQKR